MSFAPGQFITATRLNRLQPKTGWAQCSSAITGVQSNADIPGVSFSMTAETDGATANFWWHADFRDTGVAAAGTSFVQALWDVNASPLYATSRLGASEVSSAAATWSTTITTAGTYTFKLRTTTLVANMQVNIYSSLLVQIVEVA